MENQEMAKSTALQLIRQALRSRNLSRLREGFQRPWVLSIINNVAPNEYPTGNYRIFVMALEGLSKDQRQKAFKWTWDCYHPLMSDLGKALEDMDGYVKGAHI